MICDAISHKRALILLSKSILFVSLSVVVQKINLLILPGLDEDGQTDDDEEWLAYSEYQNIYISCYAVWEVILMHELS